jgi:hypothetical protein
MARKWSQKLKIINNKLFHWSLQLKTQQEVNGKYNQQPTKFYLQKVA